MKFEVSSTALLSRLQSISKVIASKNSLPILDCFLFKLNGKVLTIVASDAETRMETSMEVLSAEGEGLFAVSAKILLDPLKELPEQPLQFDINDSNLEVFIHFQNGKYNFIGQNGNIYPQQRPLKENAISLQIDSAVLLNGISRSLFATADVFTSLPSTRTQIGDMADDGALTVEWSVGDRIGVFGQSAVNEPFTSSNTEPASSTTFTGTMTGSDLPVYAYYPYQEGVTDKTAIPVEIPEVQMYRDVSSVAQYDFKATDEITDAGSGYSLKLRQMAALVRFEIDLTGVQDLADDELLLDMTIHPSGESMDGAAPMTGRFTYNLTNLDAGLQPGEYTMDGITIQFAIPPTAREKAIAYAVVAPGKHKGNEWTCVFTTDRQQGTFTTTALCDFEAGMYYVVPLTATTLENNDAVIEDIPEELQEETANCYIVTEPGEHSFKATVIGNGQKGIIPGAGFHTENPYINPKSAKVLWSDRKDFVTDVRLENGRVVYTIPDAIASSVDGSIYGNAVIAVYSEPDCQGEILWSWHIWGTQGMPQDVEYTNQAGAKFMVMDRDLGRSSAKSSFNDNNVLRYQWGAKTRSRARTLRCVASISMVLPRRR